MAFTHRSTLRRTRNSSSRAADSGRDGERLPRRHRILSSWGIYPVFVLTLPSKGTRRASSFSSELSPEALKLHPPPASCSKKTDFPLGGQEGLAQPFPDLPTSCLSWVSILSALISPPPFIHYTQYTHTTHAHTPHTPSAPSTHTTPFQSCGPSVLPTLRSSLSTARSQAQVQSLAPLFRETPPRGDTSMSPERSRAQERGQGTLTSLWKTKVTYPAK